MGDLLWGNQSDFQFTLNQDTLTFEANHRFPPISRRFIHSTNNHSLRLAQQEVELVAAHWDHNEMLQQTVTLHALELALAEAGCRRANEVPEETVLWLQVLEELIVRLQERRPEDEGVRKLQQQVELLQGIEA